MKAYLPLVFVLCFGVLSLAGQASNRTLNVWTGAAGTGWNDPLNWSLGSVPDSVTDVLIPTGLSSYPTVASVQNCLGLNVENGASLTIGNGELTVNGNFVCSGLLRMNSAPGELTVNQDVTFAAGATANVTANANLTLSGNLTFAAGSAVTITDGAFNLVGSANSLITNHAATTVNSLKLQKDAGFGADICSASTAILNVRDNIQVFSGSTLYHGYTGTTAVKGNLIAYSGGLCQFNAGILHFPSPGSSMVNLADPGNYLNHIRVSKTSYYNVILSSDITVKGNVIIEYGLLNPVSHTIHLGGDWIDLAGVNGFSEGGSTVVLNGTAIQMMTTENFDTLVIDKPSGLMLVPGSATLRCNSLDWQSGGYWVSGGTFTALDLADAGIYGSVTLNSGSINLSQDTAQNFNLCGNLSISGGELHLYGGLGTHGLAATQDASLTMSNGLYYAHDLPICVCADYALVSDISGGTIRTNYDFHSYRADFLPQGGTLELTGTAPSLLGAVAPLYDLNVAKAGTTVTLDTALACAGEITVNSGTLDLGPGGALAVGLALNVHNGATLRSLGDSTQNALITRQGNWGNYDLTVLSGGTLEAAYTVFEHMSALGVNLCSGAILDPDHCLNHCTFQNGVSGGALLTLDNAQTLTIQGAAFPENTSGASCNVSKTTDQGYVLFTDYTGAFAGPDFEQDPHSRIFWSQAGLPAVENLQISLNPITGFVYLDWDYPLPAYLFFIYRSDLPAGPYEFYGSSTATSWSEAPEAGPRHFYQVTAVLPD